MNDPDDVEKRFESVKKEILQTFHRLHLDRVYEVSPQEVISFHYEENKDSPPFGDLIVEEEGLVVECYTCSLEECEKMVKMWLVNKAAVRNQDEDSILTELHYFLFVYFILAPVILINIAIYNSFFRFTMVTINSIFFISYFIILSKGLNYSKAIEKRAKTLAYSQDIRDDAFIHEYGPNTSESLDTWIFCSVFNVLIFILLFAISILVMT